MIYDNFHLLEQLTTTYSPSGFEDSAKDLFKKIVFPYVDECYEDIHGNLVCQKNNNAFKTLLLMAHIDEVGLMVNYIEDSGFIRFSTIGGVDISLLNGTSVVILHGTKSIYGVIGTCPIHLKKNGSSNDVEVSDMWIDIGVNNKEEAELLVSIGDGISIDSQFHQLNNNLISCRATDDKAGLIVLANVLANISSESLDFNIYVVATIQEEVGIRGAITSTYSINPDVCIAIDVTHATDYPSINKAKYGDVKINGGVVIPVGTDFSHKLQNKLKRIAIDHNIAFQTEARPGFSGTDIHAAQVSRGGCITGLVSIPCRYMHSPNEVVSMTDINCAIRLMTEFCKIKYGDW